MILLAKGLAIPINDSISVMGAPRPLVAFIVALIIRPEAAGAAKAAFEANQSSGEPSICFSASGISNDSIDRTRCFIDLGVMDQPRD
ncbi:hypothetical protein O9929_24455 [Vibrio lentus]|nr:hypothetical protein [Vibrio lentus]